MAAVESTGLEWRVEAERILDSLARSKSEGPIEFMTKPMIEKIRVRAEAIAAAQGKPVYFQHVCSAAAEVVEEVNTARWWRKHR
jgi:hypothetical protein